tara:strand:+ start:11334 stop:12188 length:855 start_codon:yes stop_codon:yes gene_type:complete
VLLSSTVWAQQTVDQSQRVQENIDQAGRQTQNRIDDLSEKARNMLDEYRRAKDQAAGLKVYNRQLATQVDSQNEELDSIQSQLSNIDQTKREFVPFMVQAIDTLAVFVQRDVPFLVDEREQRVADLRELMGRADVTTAEQFRQIMSAYQTEIDYGSNIGTYEGEIQLDGEPRTVEFLRIGRVALLYQTLDGRQTGYWSAAEAAWRPAPDYRRTVEHGINVASEQAPPDLLNVPLSAPASPRVPATFKTAAVENDSEPPSPAGNKTSSSESSVDEARADQDQDNA